MSFSSDSTAAEVPSPRHRLYKTKLCKHFMRGNCLYGLHCAFSHAEGHMGLLNHPPPPTISLADKLSIEDEFERSRRMLVDEVMIYGLSEPFLLPAAELRRLTEHWKNGHIRPRKRLLRSPVVEPNLRLRPKDYILFKSNTGVLTWLPPSRPNPTLKNVEPEILNDKYRREWTFTIRPNQGQRLTPVDVRLHTKISTS